MDYSNTYSSSSSYLGNTSSTFGSQSFLEWIQSISWQTWLIVALVLSILGFNVFYYVAQGSQQIHQWMEPILSFFGQNAANATKQVVNTAATGINGITNTTANTINTGINVVQGEASSSSGTTVIPNPPMQNAENSLTNAMNGGSVSSVNAGMTSIADNNTYTANLQPEFQAPLQPIGITANSSITPQSGWCYIGEEQGYRSCASVGVNDTCMSGDIFPTKDICVNPNLRQ